MWPDIAVGASEYRGVLCSSQSVSELAYCYCTSCAAFCIYSTIFDYRTPYNTRHDAHKHGILLPRPLAVDRPTTRRTLDLY